MNIKKMSLSLLFLTATCYGADNEKNKEQKSKKNYVLPGLDDKDRRVYRGNTAKLEAGGKSNETVEALEAFNQKVNGGT